MQTVRFSLGENTAHNLFHSKIGGNPYLPIGRDYPMHDEKQRPLMLLCQINFAEMPQLENFPAKGILQFFIDGLDDECFGIDFDNMWKQDGFRIIYYPELLPDNQLQTDFSTYKIEKPYSEYGFNLLGEYSIAFEEVIDEGNMWADYDEKNNGNKIGGIPYFAQGDPFVDYSIENIIEGDADLSGAEKFIMLLQIGLNDDKLWGRYSTANFFIKPKNLKNLDFSEVAFAWAGG